jgi:hypothetical protein
MFSPCFAKRRASDKDLPVLKPMQFLKITNFFVISATSLSNIANHCNITLKGGLWNFLLVD